ncbi:MAG: heavy metal translocating P-type ATPase [Gudongella sp.]|nr:heavy metal translocating P-type ATPase [Gudongella sp.]
MKAVEIVNFFEPHVHVSQRDKEKNKDIHPEAGHDHSHNHGHDHDHDHGHDHSRSSKEMRHVAIGAVLFVIGLIFPVVGIPRLLLFLIAYIFAGGEVVLRAARNITRGQIFDENFLMTIATIGAFAIGEYPEGVAVMLFYQTGEYFQNMAVNRSRKSIASLMNIRPDYANLIDGTGSVKVSPESLEVGDEILVKPGERVPVDGIVLDGYSSVDTSALTGESVPREVVVDNEVLSGFVNISGLLKIRVSKIYSESTVTRILELVEEASARKAPTENFITRFARYYTPAVVFTALALAVIPPIILSGETFSDWLYRALIFLVISCPCALVISIPLGFFGGVGGASRHGILVKGGNYLEALNSADTIVLDKTGTLTEGVFEVSRIKTMGRLSDDELLEIAAYAESHSTHPIAQSIVKAYGKPLDGELLEKHEEHAGRGISTVLRGKHILVGNDTLFNERGILKEENNHTGTIVNIAVDGVYEGFIGIEDKIKDNASSAIAELKKLGVKKITMLTGDNRNVAEAVAERLGIDEFYSELLPQDKVKIVEEIETGMQSGKKLIFVGDGINDAPVLAKADIGIAMGAMGSDAAIEAADVVLMTDDLSKLPDAIRIARKTRSIVWQNIGFALAVKGIVLILGAGGVATMWEAVFADVGVALIAVLNAMRAMNYEPKSYKMLRE